MKKKLLIWVSLLCLLFCVWLSLPSAGAEIVIVAPKSREDPSDQVNLTVPEEITGFQNVRIQIASNWAGPCQIVISDQDGLVRDQIDCTVKAGKNRITWEAAARFGQPLYEGTYEIRAVVKDENGKEHTGRASTSLTTNAQAILLGLPSSDVLYLMGEENWYAEACLARRGSVRMDVCDKDGSVVASVGKMVEKNETVRLYWNGRVANGAYILPGTYTLRFYEENRPEKCIERQLHVQDKEDDPKNLCSIGMTGSVIPDRSEKLSDQEIWALLMQPSVIVRGATNEEISVLAEPKVRTPTIGVIHAQSQALEIREIFTDENGREWARIHAYSQWDGSELDGYLPTESMEVRLPDRQYGLVLNKRKQTLSVYENGTCLGTIPVSTGLSAAGTSRRETVCGAFFLAERTTYTSLGEERFDYAIRYDGFRVLTQTGYIRKNGVVSVVGEKNLGKPATRGSVSMSAAGDLPVNAWWVYTHLPRNTKILVVGDSVTKEEEVISEDASEMTFLMAKEVIRLTLGGVLSTSIPENGQGSDFESDLPDALKALSSILLADDGTVMTLGSVLKDSPADGHADRVSLRRRPAGDAGKMKEVGIDILSTVNAHLSDYHYAGAVSTNRALKQAGLLAVTEGSPVCLEKKGHRIGLIALSLQDCLQEWNICESEVLKARAMGCEVVIAICDWGMPNANWHNQNQTEMAKRLAAAGADLILGTGGELQGLERMDQVPVFWSLGSLLDPDRVTNDSCLVQVDLAFEGTEYTGMRLELICLTEEDGRVRLAEGKERDSVLSVISRNSTLGLTNLVFPREKSETADVE